MRPAKGLGALPPFGGSEPSSQTRAGGDHRLLELDPGETTTLAIDITNYGFFAGDDGEVLVDAFAELTGVSPDGDPDLGRSPWLSVTNHLIAWDTPPPPDYQRLKGELFTIAEPGWAPFFDDLDAMVISAVYVLAVLGVALALALSM